jgi:hypothetical protein
VRNVGFLNLEKSASCWFNMIIFTVVTDIDHVSIAFVAMGTIATGNADV